MGTVEWVEREGQYYMFLNHLGGMGTLGFFIRIGVISMFLNHLGGMGTRLL